VLGRRRKSMDADHPDKFVVMKCSCILHSEAPFARMLGDPVSSQPLPLGVHELSV
jgi:hypothetical protein